MLPAACHCAISGCSSDASTASVARALPYNFAYNHRLPGVNRVEIHCDAANAGSAAVARRLGYRLDRIEEWRPEAPGESGRLMIWVRERPSTP